VNSATRGMNPTSVAFLPCSSSYFSPYSKSSGSWPLSSRFIATASAPSRQTGRGSPNTMPSTMPSRRSPTADARPAARLGGMSDQQPAHDSHQVPPYASSSPGAYPQPAQQQPVQQRPVPQQPVPQQPAAQGYVLN